MIVWHYSLAAGMSRVVFSPLSTGRGPRAADRCSRPGRPTRAGFSDAIAAGRSRRAGAVSASRRPSVVVFDVSRSRAGPPPDDVHQTPAPMGGHGPLLIEVWPATADGAEITTSCSDRAGRRRAPQPPLQPPLAVRDRQRAPAHRASMPRRRVPRGGACGPLARTLTGRARARAVRPLATTARTASLAASGRRPPVGVLRSAETSTLPDQNFPAQARTPFSRPARLPCSRTLPRCPRRSQRVGRKTVGAPRPSAPPGGDTEPASVGAARRTPRPADARCDGSSLCLAVQDDRSPLSCAGAPRRAGRSGPLPYSAAPAGDRDAACSRSSVKARPSKRLRESS